MSCAWQVQIRFDPADEEWHDIDKEKVEFTGPGSAEIKGLEPEASQAFADALGAFRIRGCNQGGAGPWSAPSE